MIEKNFVLIKREVKSCYSTNQNTAKQKIPNYYNLNQAIRKFFTYVIKQL